MKESLVKKLSASYNFTLFELLISIGLLVVLAVVLLRTLFLTANYWNKTDERAQLQADAKIVFSLLTDELGNIVYQPKSDPSDSGFYAPILLEKVDGESRLWFVTHSRLQNTDDHGEGESDVCKVAYRFVPSTGVLERACCGDNMVGVTGKDFYDFSVADSDYYPIAMFSEREQVIGSIADMTFKAYKADNSQISDSSSFDSDEIRYIRVKLELLPAKRFEEYKDLSNTTTPSQAEFMAKYGRVFYKTFWIKPLDRGAEYEK